MPISLFIALFSLVLANSAKAVTETELFLDEAFATDMQFDGEAEMESDSGFVFAAAVGSKVLLTEKNVGAAMTRVSVSIPNCGKNMDSIRLKVKDSAMKLAGAGATFTDGTTKNVGLSRSLGLDYKSPWIGLGVLGASATKCVKTVFVNVSATDGTGRLKIEGFTK